MNDEMVMKGGVERSANPNNERMLNVFDLYLSAPEEKAVSKITYSEGIKRSGDFTGTQSLGFTREREIW
jgi:hypothetical protein